MKILVFAHSGSPGGAEKAVRHLIRLLKGRHEVHVVLPNLEGGEADYFASVGVPCHPIAPPLALPDFSSAVLRYAATDLRQIAAALAPLRFDLALTNTLAILHGAILARHLGIAHLTYVHEFLQDPELLPTSISKACYLKTIEDLSAQVISCSRFVAGQFSMDKRVAMEVLEPHEFSAPAIARQIDAECDYVVQAIGTQSSRKNLGFAATVVKSLGLRGLEVRLDIIGSTNNDSGRLEKILRKRKINCRVIPALADPYAVNARQRVVTLVSSTSEPYGLTLPESLMRGIPVLASRSGGPRELLPDEFLYEPNDLDTAVRKLETLFAEYDRQTDEAQRLYSRLKARHPVDNLAAGLDRAIEHARRCFDPSRPSFLMDAIDAAGAVTRPPITAQGVCENIAAVCEESSGPAAVDPLSAALRLEEERPGTAVLGDIRRFDVVPFATSSGMNALYRNGIGLAIELASTFEDAGRLEMASFIACALGERRRATGHAVRVLALGDGIGIDSIRLAAAGFEVDFLDHDGSRLAKVAALNFRTAQAASPVELSVRVIDGAAGPYDAIVCLEVIEHVPSPVEFASYLSGHLKSDGLLFISECFDGIEDRWPTHLHSNESFSGMLPFMVRSAFSFQNPCSPAMRKCSARVTVARSPSAASSTAARSTRSSGAASCGCAFRRPNTRSPGASRCGSSKHLPTVGRLGVPAGGAAQSTTVQAWSPWAPPPQFRCSSPFTCGVAG